MANTKGKSNKPLEHVPQACPNTEIKEFLYRLLANMGLVYVPNVSWKNLRSLLKKNIHDQTDFPQKISVLKLFHHLQLFLEAMDFCQQQTLCFFTVAGMVCRQVGMIFRGSKGDFAGFDGSEIPNKHLGCMKPCIFIGYVSYQQVSREI